MANKEIKEKFKTMIGGQALIEGIMMMGPEKVATVVRTKGELKTKLEDRKPVKKHSVKKIPFLRGMFNFFDSMKTGVSALMYSAQFMEDEEEVQGEQSRFDAWLERKLSSEKTRNGIVTVAAVIGILFNVALFFIVPSLIGSFINQYITPNELVRNLIEGLIRVALLVGYMWLTSLMKDMKRTYGYHGAEHKTIRCYEAKLPLTVENVRSMSRMHPRCGTSFLFVVVFISVLVFSVASYFLAPITPVFESGILNALIRVALKLLLLPIVVSLSYEFNRLVGRYDNLFTRILSAPGIWLQHVTTNEPDDSMIEVGIAALTAVLPKEEGTDQW